MNKKKYMLIAIATSLVLGVYSDEVSRVDIPLAMTIDNEIISTPLYINVGLKWYSCNAMEMNRDCDQDEALYGVLMAINGNEIEDLATRIEKRIEKERRIQIAKGMVDALGGLLGNAQIIARMDGLEGDKIYFCRISLDERSSWFGFRIIKDSNGEYVWGVDEENNLIYMTAESFYKSYDNDSIRREGDVSAKYIKTIKGIDASRVEIKFNGSIFDFNTFAENENCYSELLSRYREIHIAVADKSPEIASGNFTRDSAEKYMRWIEYIPSGLYKDYVEKYKTTRRVFFIIDASPVYIYFYTNHAEKIEHIKHDVLYKVKNGKLMYANFNTEGLSDKFLSDDLFLDALLDEISSRTDAADE